MIRTVAYYILAVLFLACALMSLITGQGGIHEFEISAPASLVDYATFIPNLVIDFVQFLVSCVSWSFLPDLPTTLRIILVAMSSLPVAYVIIVDIVPPLARAIGSIVDAFLPG